MSLRFTNSLTSRTEAFEPLEAGKATIYCCGVTVYDLCHLGHARSYINWDVLRRYLIWRGYDVTYVQNYTDIDDKILNRANEEGSSMQAVSERNIEAFEIDMGRLNILPADRMPRATGCIDGIQKLISELEAKGAAYSSDGDVYFDISKAKDYGKLSGRDPNEQQQGASGRTADGEESRKRHPFDFALWKGAKEGEPSWDSPWGPGRPGWHIECSAMARKYLGSTFDIHGGGLDLVFPHHENEIAQSRCVGDGFANYWLHNAWVTTAGEKMSKSLGNSLLVSEVVRRVRPIELRYYLAGAHYRSMLEFSDAMVTDAGQGFQRIEGFLARAAEVIGDDFDVDANNRHPDFDEAMDDDINTPQAIAVIHGVVREGNAAIARGDTETVRSRAQSVVAMLDVLGLNPSDWRRGDAGGRLEGAVDALVAVALEQRQAARERKDFASADAIRDQLKAAGIEIEDTPDGPRWSLSDDGGSSDGG